MNTQSISVYGEQPRRTTEVTPVTQQLAYMQVVSNGPENDANAGFPVAEFSRVIAEQSSKDIKVMPTPKEPPRTGGHGGIMPAWSPTVRRGSRCKNYGDGGGRREDGVQFTEIHGRQPAGTRSRISPRGFIAWNLQQLASGHAW